MKYLKTEEYSMGIKVLAPAKINLGLSIKGKRKDGYHEVDMVMQSVSLYDIVEIHENNSNNIDILCSENLICNDKQNTAYKAAEKFFEYTDIKNSGILIKIEKNIPVCAGLAGGSSDGAAVICGLNKLFHANLSVSDMCSIGAKIGSDVPFCILGGTARAYGIGTTIKKIKDFVDCEIVIAKPNCSVSTKEAYRLYDISNYKSRFNTENLVDLINKENLKEISNYLFIDFENFIHNPQISDLKGEIIKSEPLGVCMSGSGPTIFAIFKDSYKANLCVNKLSKNYKDVYLCRPIKCGVKIF